MMLAYLEKQEYHFCKFYNMKSPAPREQVTLLRGKIMGDSHTGSA